MAPQYKLTYFALKALGEPIRLLLTYGKIEFEDVRILSEDWLKMKESMPLGQLPVLEFIGKTVYQSVVISRYLGKKVGLSGSNDLENLDIDIIVDTLNDLKQKLVNVHYEPDEKIREQRYIPFKDETIPFYLDKIESIAAANNGHLALGKLTWADIWFVGILDYLSFMARFDILENKPNLKAVKEKVLAIPAIKTWYQGHHFTFAPY